MLAIHDSKEGQSKPSLLHCRVSSHPRGPSAVLCEHRELPYPCNLYPPVTFEWQRLVRMRLREPCGLIVYPIRSPYYPQGKNNGGA
jgi:hypothetical protein